MISIQCFKCQKELSVNIHCINTNEESPDYDSSHDNCFDYFVDNIPQVLCEKCHIDKENNIWK